jgi:hypothetical protein
MFCVEINGRRVRVENRRGDVGFSSFLFYLQNPYLGISV